MELTIADYPNASKDKRKELHKNMYKVAYPEQKSRILKTTDVLKL
jgi:hypothetical protein